MRQLRTVGLEAGPGYHTSSQARYWPGLFNTSGRGDSRFSPFTISGKVIPTVYGACSQTVALLETVFHDVHASVGSRLITHMDLVGRNLVDFGLSERLVLYDLTDDALGRLDLQRDQLVSTTAAHYPCTREWAEALHARKGPGGSRPVGLLWNSRVAELAKGDSPLLADLLPGRPEEVFMLFGDKLTTIDPGDYSTEQRYDALASTAALPLITAIAEQLGATLA